MGSEQEVEVVGHQDPCKTSGIGLEEQFREPVKEGVPVPVIDEDITLLDSSSHDML